MEENFDDIERLMKSKKNNSKDSSDTDFNNIKAKVIAWLMRNGNIKKIAVILILALPTGIVNIILGTINNTYHLQELAWVTLFVFILNHIDNRYFNKSIKKLIKFVVSKIKRFITYISKTKIFKIIKKSSIFILTKILYLIFLIWLIDFILYCSRGFKKKKK